MKENKSLDPCGHVKLSVSNIENSKQFYSDIFEVLGYIQVKNKKESAGWISPEGYGIWIVQAEDTDTSYSSNGPGLHHLCLKGNNMKTIDRIYNLIQNLDVKVFDAPQKYPKYTENYYAVFFADPDGIKIEVAYY